MNKLSVNLENCYGIKKLVKTFDYESVAVNVIYAKNGLMKTSLAKVFEKVQNNKKNEIKDAIFGKTPVVTDIQVDENEISSDEIFVIKSFDSSYESESIASLLIDDKLKNDLSEVLKLKDMFLKKLESISGLKVSRISQGKKIYELEPTIIEDFKFTKKSILMNLDYIDIDNLKYDYSEIRYQTIFDSAVLKKIQTDDFQQKINDYILKSNEIYQEYSYLEKGEFTLPKLKEIQKRLKDNRFYTKDNKLLLEGYEQPMYAEDVNKEIKKIEKVLKDTKEFNEIEKQFSDTKGMALKDLIESNPDIIDELKTDNIEQLKKKLWLSYLNYYRNDFLNLKTKYKEFKNKIDNVDKDETHWKKAIDIFNNRFKLPFTMEIENLESSIIGESIPKVGFYFYDNDSKASKPIKFNRDELESTDTLSQGEKRGLYLLNIIFDIEKRKVENKKTLYVIDDIADSFDYKNKYAIIEYLNDISKQENFYLLILSHNFDFYRSITSRLDLSRKHKLHAENKGSEISVEEEFYQKQPVKLWKIMLKKGNKYDRYFSSIEANKHILALIPFIRNIIDYSIDKKVNQYTGIETDFEFLTELLHQKKNTKIINFGHLKSIFDEYIGNNDFDSSIGDKDIVYNNLLCIAEKNISYDDIKLENKIILLMAIRLLAEEYMITKINDSSITSEIKGNQTRKLYEKIKELNIIEEKKMKLLESVNIMTPENIHINSFMYEPIIDMDIIELKDLYSKIIKL